MTIDSRSVASLFQQMEQNWPDSVTPVSRMMLRVFRLNAIIRANAERCAREEALDFTEFQILAMLRRESPPHQLTPNDLCAFLQITSGGLTKALTRLEGRDLITRSVSDQDRRSKPVRLTPAGGARIERAMAHVLRSDGELLEQGLTPKQMETMITLLTRLVEALESNATPSAAKT
ncbi:MarR family winged helix-turn-helix transcriptional regulator [Magnetofaba australis]|uniref:Putative MarR family transcriptional regulator n=1 Tax=Magnetofaba australis IT-1 TaxID=1434232 RepID=A0A1Y2K5J3_9PROT|nr:MarR family transcriptional regulator [Magnetofaba australis]OSM04899.1 putative MarR family transcriptional regulator [Magnetofaba australis IT-1]